MSGVDQCYLILGLHSGASQREIKEAYRDLAKVWHPDRFSNDPRLQVKAQEQFKQIHSAYTTLHCNQAATPSAAAPRRAHTPSGSPPRSQPRKPAAPHSSRSVPVAYSRFMVTAKVIALVLTIILVRSLLTLCFGEM